MAWRGILTQGLAHASKSGLSRAAACAAGTVSRQAGVPASFSQVLSSPSAMMATLRASGQTGARMQQSAGLSLLASSLLSSRAAPAAFSQQPVQQSPPSASISAVDTEVASHGGGEVGEAEAGDEEDNVPSSRKKRTSAGRKPPDKEPPWLPCLRPHQTASAMQWSAPAPQIPRQPQLFNGQQTASVMQLRHLNTWSAPTPQSTTRGMVMRLAPDPQITTRAMASLAAPMMASAGSSYTLTEEAGAATQPAAQQELLNVYILSSGERHQRPLSGSDLKFLWQKAEEQQTAKQLARAQLGRAGPTQAWLSSVGDLLESCELVRVNVPQSAGYDVKFVAWLLQETQDCVMVKIKGHTLTVFRDVSLPRPPTSRHGIQRSPATTTTAAQPPHSTAQEEAQQPHADSTSQSNQLPTGSASPGNNVSQPNHLQASDASPGLGASHADPLSTGGISPGTTAGPQAPQQQQPDGQATAPRDGARRMPGAVQAGRAAAGGTAAAGKRAGGTAVAAQPSGVASAVQSSGMVPGAGRWEWAGSAAEEEEADRARGRVAGTAAGPAQGTAEEEQEKEEEGGQRERRRERAGIQSALQGLGLLQRARLARVHAPAARLKLLAHMARARRAARGA